MDENCFNLVQPYNLVEHQGLLGHLAYLVPKLRRQSTRIGRTFADDCFQSAIAKLLEVLPMTLEVVEVADWYFCNEVYQLPLPPARTLLTITKREMRDTVCKLLYGRHDYSTFKKCGGPSKANYMRSMQNESVALEEFNRQLAYLIAKYPGRHFDNDLYPLDQTVTQYQRVHTFIVDRLDETDRDLFLRFYPWGCHTTKPLAEYLKVSLPTAHDRLKRLDATISRILENYPFIF